MRSIARPLLAFLLYSLATTTAAAADLLLAINKGDNTVAIIDAATLKVVGTAPTGPDPHEVVASADGKLAYITNYFAGNGVANSISVVDLVAMKALPPIDLGPLGRPHGITLAGGKVYFTAEGAKVVGRYDPATRRVDWVIGTGQDRTHMVIVSSDEKRLFTTNVASATVSILEQFTVTRRGGPPRAPRRREPPEERAGAAQMVSRQQQPIGASPSCRSAWAPKDSTCLRTAGSCGSPTHKAGVSRSSTSRRRQPRR